MKFFFWTLVLVSALLFVSPVYSLYKIGMGIKEKDKEVLNGYILWNELQKNVKKDVRRFLKKRAKERKKDIDNPIDGIFEDIKRVYNNHGRFQTTNVLSASLRDVRQVEQSFLMGADVCTIPPLVFWKMYKNILTDKGLELFQADWDDVNK